MHLLSEALANDKINTELLLFLFLLLFIYLPLYQNNYYESTGGGGGRGAEWHSGAKLTSYGFACCFVWV
jgi:hypothetical protein